MGEQFSIVPSSNAPGLQDIGPVAVNASMGGDGLTLAFPQDIDIDSMLNQWDQNFGEHRQQSH